MSHTVPSHHPAGVRRSNYQLVRALLAVALIAIVGLTIALATVAASNTTSVSPAAHHTAAATSARPLAEIGAKLDHRGRNTAGAQAASLATASRQVAIGARLFDPKDWAYPVH